ncbi:putative membrane protein [Serratia plymuthica A30]|nr:putative membrane protein [Serratia plymuthica A30]
MIKRIGMLLSVAVLASALSACCFGPHGGGPGHYYNHY